MPRGRRSMPPSRRWKVAIGASYSGVTGGLESSLECEYRALGLTECERVLRTCGQCNVQSLSGAIARVALAWVQKLG